MNVPLGTALNRQLLSQSKLSTADYAVLVQLSESPDVGIRARELVQLVGWEKSRLSHHIRRMETRQLVARQECPTDGRGALIVITPTGLAALEQAAPGHVSAVRTYFIDLLTPEQLDAFAEIAETVGRRLAASCLEYSAADAWPGEVAESARDSDCPSSVSAAAQAAPAPS